MLSIGSGTHLFSNSDSIKLQLPVHCAQRWALIHKVFTHYDPGSPLETGFANVDRKQLYAEHWETCRRPHIVDLPNHLALRARKNHAAFVERIPALARAFSFPKRSRGIVTTAGSALMPMLLVSLKLLRRTGCTLPVEVFIASFADYEPLVCEKILPSLNAKCVMFGDDFLDIQLPNGKPELEAYQFKPFVILMSSFNEVLFLDTDNFPVTNPELLFKSEPFLETGLIVWPDFWCASQSPLFYEITATPEPPIRDRPGSESGQIMYDKNRHVEDLLLACYYSYYGPGLWYPLLSQGFPGEGDKETYIAAAAALKKPFYQARQLPGMLAEENAIDFAILQVNPAVDYAEMEAGKTWQELESPQAFIHHHFPKLDAQLIREFNHTWIVEKHDRMWGPADRTWELFGLDLEYEVWKAINYTACDLGGIFQAWEGYESSCDFVQNHIRSVFLSDSVNIGS
ncbi:mannosyltransferase [Cladophialophora chaetospira]|uniref:Mannosyltransferase n=1 Tax=Cladophialophora chaetospira TaxID=386627 RepID=A0AA38X3Q6_9EURO|nr:mannosyltransferase [Cladophialophora chaetospira]